VNYRHVAICCDTMTYRCHVPDGYFLISIINDHIFYKLISNKYLNVRLIISCIDHYIKKVNKDKDEEE
jgi:hypothetical protein